MTKARRAKVFAIIHTLGYLMEVEDQLNTWIQADICFCFSVLFVSFINRDYEWKQN